MKARRVAIATSLCGVLCLAFFSFPPAPAVAITEPAPGAAGWMYEAGTVVAIDLTLSPTEKAKLEAEPDKYVKGTFSLSKTDGTPGGSETPVATSLPIEVRLKGNVLGSFRTLDGKAAFKLKFKKTEPFLGLRKMTLNNMVEDHSSIHETLAYTLFRGAGIAAPRTGFAYVRLNGEDFGTYLNLENLDKVNLERWFGPFNDPQHLYEGEDGVDVEPGKAGEFEIDEGSEASRADLEALITAVNSPVGAGWADRVSAQVDLAEMTRMWAVEKYIGHWDGYSGEEDSLKPNNYYLYSDPTGKFQMLPWGTDNTWEPYRRTAFDGDAGLLFDDCLADPACAQLYRQALRGLQGTIAALNLDSLAVKTAHLLEPWEQQEQANSRHEHSLAQIETGVNETRSFIADRPAELAAFLGPEAVPMPPSTASDQPKPPTPNLYVGHSRREAAALVTHLWFPSPGTVSQTATIKTAHGLRNACSVNAAVPNGGAWNLRCLLAPSVLSRLRPHGLTLRVWTSFTPQGGSRESTFRCVHLARFDAR